MAITFSPLLATHLPAFFLEKTMDAESYSNRCVPTRIGLIFMLDQALSQKDSISGEEVGSGGCLLIKIVDQKNLLE